MSDCIYCRLFVHVSIAQIKETMPFIVSLIVEDITWSISNNRRKQSNAGMKRVSFTQLRTLFDLRPICVAFRFQFTTIHYIIATNNTELFSLSAHFVCICISTFGIKNLHWIQMKNAGIFAIEFPTSETSKLPHSIISDIFNHTSCILAFGGLQLIN